MATKIEFAGKVREEIDRLRQIAGEAESISDASPTERAVAAEFLREAIADCEDAILAL